MTTLRAGAATDVGRVRRNNEDQFLVAEPLFAVADGMGGAAGGEEASQTAVAALRESFADNPTADGLAAGVRVANQAVWEQALKRPDLRGMGTTMTAVALVADDDQGDVIAIANVGDSRVYLLRDGQLDQITDDHSVPEELRRRGQLTPEEAAVHPLRNMLTRVLGNEPDVEVDCFAIVPYRGDRLVLASDGLFNEVDDTDIESVVRRLPDPTEAATELVELARTNGGNDNITVVVVDVVDDGDRAERASAAVAPAGRHSTTTTATAIPRQPERTPPESDDATGSAAGDVTTTIGTRPAAAPALDTGAPRSTPGPAPATPRAQSVRPTPPPPPPPVISRRSTLRAVVFLIALVVVLAGAGVAVGVFARGGYFVGVDGQEVVIFKGRAGGLLWFDPTVAERTGVSLSEVRPSRAQDLRDGKEEPSLAEARRYVANLQDEAAPPTTTTTTAAATVTTVAPSPIPLTTAPSAPVAGVP